MLGERLKAEMPGGKRTERISKRDLEVLEFVARFGMVPREVVALWAGTARAVTAARERRLREAGLIEVLPGFGEIGRLLLCTRRGLRVVGRDDLSTPTFSPAVLQHTAVAARIAAQLEVSGRRVLSEREILAAERLSGERLYTIELRRGRKHRPDLILLGEANEAIEVELTNKAPRRLEGLVRAWRRSVGRGGQFGRVHYLCSPRTHPHVTRAVSRLYGEEVIHVEELEQRNGCLTLAVGSPTRGLAGWNHSGGGPARCNIRSQPLSRLRG